MIFIKLSCEILKPTLLHIAKKVRLKKYSRLRKYQLVELLNTHFASLFCARLYLNHKKKHFVNETDPLTMDELKYPFFEIELTKGKYYRYNMISFYNYMIKTGNFKDPYTDTEFSTNQLKQMDKQLKNCGFLKQSLYSIKINPNKQKYYARLNERQNCLLGMDREIGQLLTEMCDDLFEKLDSGLNVEHSCYHTLIHMFLPNLIYLLEQLKNVDIQYTRKCLMDYISWVNNQNVPLGNVITNMLKNELQCIS